MLAAGLLVAPTPPTFAQDSERNPQADPSDQAGHRPGAAAFPPPNADIGDDPELKAKADKLQAAFRSVTDQLRAAVLKQQAMAIRYANEEANSPADRRAYYLQRQTVRDLLKKTYAAALDLVQVRGDQDSATYLGMMTQHRLMHDIYDRQTMEGAQILIEAGWDVPVLYQAAARSAVVAGEFDKAEQWLQTLNESDKEDVDRRIEFQLDDYRKMAKAEEALDKQQAGAEPLPQVKLETTQGDVVVELFIDQAPSTVSHFISLVEEGFYDGLDFYQVIDDLLALTGDPTGLGSGNAGKFVVDEHDRKQTRQLLRGSLMMAKIPANQAGDLVPDSASSQFAILFLPLVPPKKNQTVFGRVVEGMDAISRLRRVDPSKEKKEGEIVLPPDRIIEATVIRRPEELPEPKYVDLLKTHSNN